MQILKITFVIGGGRALDGKFNVQTCMASIAFCVKCRYT